MSLRKFFFDDVRKAPASDWIVAKDVPEAKQTIALRSFDVMSLDHDIGFAMMCDECRNELHPFEQQIALTAAEIEKLEQGCNHNQTGTHLAKWMVEQIIEWPRLIIIHSANPYGAQRMYDILSPHTLVVIIPYDKCQYDTIAEEK